jgi:SAM-dependent methyltransferase
LKKSIINNSVSKDKNALIKLKLLKLYKKNNPSLPTNLKKRLKTTEKTFNRLSFPLRFLKNLTVGDFACGTGEYCMVASKYASRVDGYDFNKISIDKAKINSKKLKIKNCNFYQKEFFLIKKKYDLVICTAALHHLPNPYQGLKYLQQRVKKGGFLLLSFGLDSSNITHNLLKLIVRNWGKNENDINKSSKFLFKNHIDRCVKFGLRKEEAVIADQFINTQHYYMNLKKVFKILEKSFVLHGSWPPKFLPQSDSINNITTQNTDFRFSEILWSTKTIDDNLRAKSFLINANLNSFKKLKSTLNNKSNKSLNEILKKNKFLFSKNNFKYSQFDFSFSLNSHVINFYKELFELMIFFNKKKRNLYETKKEIDKKKFIFKGTNGLGLNHFLFRKIDEK